MERKMETIILSIWFGMIGFMFGKLYGEWRESKSSFKRILELRDFFYQLHNIKAKENIPGQCICKRNLFASMIGTDNRIYCCECNKLRE